MANCRILNSRFDVSAEWQANQDIGNCPNGIFRVHISITAH